MQPYFVSWFTFQFSRWDWQFPLSGSLARAQTFLSRSGPSFSPQKFVSVLVPLDSGRILAPGRLLTQWPTCLEAPTALSYNLTSYMPLESTYFRPNRSSISSCKYEFLYIPFVGHFYKWIGLLAPIWDVGGHTRTLRRGLVKSLPTRHECYS